MAKDEQQQTTLTQQILVLLIVLVFVVLLVQLTAMLFQAGGQGLTREECLRSGAVWSGSDQVCYGYSESETSQQSPADP